MLKFNKAAKNYLAHNLLQRHSLAIINDMLPKNPHTVLDVGCGPGEHLKALQKKYPMALIVGCDNSHNMLELAKSSKVKLVAADANNLPFTKNCFDLIVSNMLLQWLPDLDKTFTNLWHITKYNGEFIAATLGNESLKEARHAFATIGREQNINNFYDIHTIGNSLQNNNWQEIYTGSEIIKIEFDSPHSVFENLRLTGANSKTNPNANNDYLTKNEWHTCMNNYPKQNNKFYATFEIITMRGKKVLPKNQIDPQQIGRI